MWAGPPTRKAVDFPTLFLRSIELRLRATPWLLAVLLIVPGWVQAETLVLVQGYLGQASDWHKSGITKILEEAGWANGGMLQNARAGVGSGTAPPRASRRFYTLALPSEAPLMVQAKYLEDYVGHLRRLYPDSGLILVGHSAGGVLGRLYMVRHPDADVLALITIASPHLGTESAELGAMVGQSPLAWLAPLLGADTLNRSLGLYNDLARERPTNFLYWLNHQPHPRARYVSIVRKDSTPFGVGNMIVPEWSQDMNRVFMLQGRAWTILAPGEHGLKQTDGTLLLRILASLHSA